MAEPSARIEATTSCREPEGQPSPARPREKERQRPKNARPPIEMADLSDPDELDDLEEHTLDTVA